MLYSRNTLKKSTTKFAACKAVKQLLFYTVIKPIYYVFNVLIAVDVADS